MPYDEGCLVFNVSLIALRSLPQKEIHDESLKLSVKNYCKVPHSIAVMEKDLLPNFENNKNAYKIKVFNVVMKEILWEGVTYLTAISNIVYATTNDLRQGKEQT